MNIGTAIGTVLRTMEAFQKLELVIGYRALTHLLLLLGVSKPGNWVDMESRVFEQATLAKRRFPGDSACQEWSKKALEKLEAENGGDADGAVEKAASLAYPEPDLQRIGVIKRGRELPAGCCHSRRWEHTGWRRGAAVGVVPGVSLNSIIYYCIHGLALALSVGLSIDRLLYIRIYIVVTLPTGTPSCDTAETETSSASPELSLFLDLSLTRLLSLPRSLSP